MQSKGEILIYKAKDGSQQLEVKLEDETIWLSQKQMADLFDKSRVTITEHIRNIFKEKELNENSVCRNFRHTGSDGKSYEVQSYNLDVIISVGYRVKSKRGTQFRFRDRLLWMYNPNCSTFNCHPQESSRYGSSTSCVAFILAVKQNF